MMKAKALLCVIAFCIWMIPLCAQFAGGSGTPEDPYLVASAAQLHSVRTNLSAHYRQIAEINFSGTPYGGGTGWLPIGTEASPFTGSYDGNNYQIWGLYIHRSSGWSGLFGVISHASVKNVQIWGANVNCEYQAACLVGFLHYSSMENCSVNASSIEGYDFTGGLVSYAYESSIVACSADISLRGHESVGGIVGLLTRSGIRDCHAQFSFSSTWYQVGGIVGTAEQGSSVIDCSFAGDLRAISWTGGIVGHATDTLISGCTTGSGLMMGGDTCGGIVGDAYARVDIVNCSSAMEIRAHYSVGALVGLLERRSTAQNCHASGRVRTNWPAGGFAGSISNSSVANCYSTGEVNGTRYSGGFTGGLSSTGSLIQNCYSTGVVTSRDDEAGGFAGASVSSTASVINCYWDTQSSGCLISTVGEGRTTAQMCDPTDANTYVNWDFASIWHWQSEPAIGYPSLNILPVANADAHTPELSNTIIKSSPNPFSSSSQISFVLAKAARCELKIYDLKGRLRRRLTESFLKSGTHQFCFDGCDEAGLRLSSGIYLVSLQENGQRSVQRITLIK